MNNTQNKSIYISLKKNTNLLNIPFIKFIFDNSLYSIIFLNIIFIYIILFYDFNYKIILFFLLYQLYALFVFSIIPTYKENLLLLIFIYIFLLLIFCIILYIIYLFTHQSKIIIIKNIKINKPPRKATLVTLNKSYQIYDENNKSYTLEKLYLPTLLGLQKNDLSIISSLKNGDKIKITYYGFLWNDILNIVKI